MGGGRSQSATAVTKLQLSSGPHETPPAGRPDGYVVVGDEAAHIGARADEERGGKWTTTVAVLGLGVMATEEAGSDAGGY